MWMQKIGLCPETLLHTQGSFMPIALSAKPVSHPASFLQNQFLKLNSISLTLPSLLFLDYVNSKTQRACRQGGQVRGEGEVGLRREAIRNDHEASKSQRGKASKIGTDSTQRISMEQELVSLVLRIDLWH